MKVTYDPEVDVLSILLSDAAVEESDEEKPGVILDYDSKGNVVSIEILDATKRISTVLDSREETRRMNMDANRSNELNRIVQQLEDCLGKICDTRERTLKTMPEDAMVYEPALRGIGDAITIVKSLISTP